MIQLQRDIPLGAFNTLAIPAAAAYFVEVATPTELSELLSDAQLAALPRLILGGGSNVVLRGDFPGLVIRLAMAGIEVESRDERVRLRVAAGENWDGLVRHCLAQGWFGLENLIAIPGSVGAAPIQNIGAYGVELADVLVAVRGWDLEKKCWRRLGAGECQLGYRASIFKGALQDRFVITEVELALSTVPKPNLSYGALRDALPGTGTPSPQTVAETVAALRAEKLPDFRREPNAGSFFKNPIVSANQAAELRRRYPTLMSWPLADGQEKLAAAWLVEQCGWRGQRRGGVGVHPRQAIVLVNYEACPGEALLDLAAAIQGDVLARFGVGLEIEPRVY